MALNCDWCDEPIEGKGVAYKMSLIPFSILDLHRDGPAKGRSSIAAELHLHAEPCRENFLSAARDLARQHVPLDHEAGHNGESEEPDPEPEPPGRRAWEPSPEERRLFERRDEWMALPDHEQDRMVLEALGDTKATNAEVAERLGEGDGPCPHWTSRVGLVTRRLFKAKELDREDGRFGHCRYRYSRRKPDEAIKQLERALRDKGGDDGNR